MTVNKNYKSTAFIPLDAAKKAKSRADVLGVAFSLMPQMIIVLALEREQIPNEPPGIPEGVDKVGFAFSLDAALVEQLGGEDSARDYVRWAIMEGLDQSPLAPQK